jgi:putative GTP pyrophosphokinase
MNLSKTKIDQLGERLKRGHLSKEDLEMLDKHRLSYGDAYKHVVEILRRKLQLEPTGRPAKSTSSIIDKLHREHIRLSQVQDIAGCRIVVSDITEQDQLIPLICGVFEKSSVIDRRLKPSHGYRAVHIVVTTFGKPIEIQVRSDLQHSWAELSEKVSDFDPKVKYGGGSASAKELLTDFSELVVLLERHELVFSKTKGSSANPVENRMREKTLALKKSVQDSLKAVLASLAKGKKQ